MRFFNFSDRERTNGDMTATAKISITAPTFAGIYQASEAARYLNAADCADKAYPVSSSGLIRWIRRGLASPDLADARGADLTLTFEDLISMRVIAALRGANVGWPEIKDSERRLRETTGALRPFAAEYLWTGQGRVYADWTSRLVSAGKSGQMAFDILRQYLIPAHGLAFGEKSGVAVSWTPVKGVALRPEIQFGAPCVEDTRIPTRTIYGMIEAGDSPRFVAAAYGISTASVEEARDWESRLRAARAAIPA